MKNIFLFTLLCVFFGAKAQTDFIPLSNSVIHYYSPQNDYIVSLKFDSVKTFSDTLRFYPFKMMRVVNETTFESTLNGPNWIGAQIDVISDTIHVFYNRNNNPVTFNTRAGLNDSMIVFDNSPYYLIWAKVVSFQEETFIGITDSVKTYLLQAKDISGQNIASDWNGSEIKFSKHYGYVSIINMYQFPEHETENVYLYYGDNFTNLSISGIENPDHGQGLLDFYDMFNFSVNDEIHDVKVNVFVCNYPDVVCRDSTFSIKTLISQQWLDSATLQYTQSRCYNYKRYMDNVLVTDSSGTDTLVGIFSTLEHKSGLSYEPYSINGNYTYIINRSSSVIETNMFFSDIIGTFTWLQFDPMYYDYYYNGVGGPYYSSQFTTVSKNILLYYKNDSIEWGTPYNCIVGMQGNKPINHQIVIFPNPANDFLYINEIPVDGIDYSIISADAAEVGKGRVRDGRINISCLNKGFYILKTTTNSENCFFRFVKE